jgi:peptide-methionine (S)-S-oxide reductase
MQRGAMMLPRFYCFLLFLLLSTNAYSAMEKAVFAGGCFWCMEAAFDDIAGVNSVVVGYTGGKTRNPTYKNVNAGGTGHIEAAEITFDNTKISYQDLLAIFWKNVDPFDPNGQFCDKGDQYRSGIFYYSDSQKKIATKSLLNHQQSKRFANEKIKTFIKSAEPFYQAEKYHQNYHKKNPLKYMFYRYRCGRDKRLEKVWGP